MTFPLFYQKIRRSSRLVEHSEPHEKFDNWVVRKNEHKDEVQTIHTSVELYNLLNQWFRYVEDGAEGCDRAEGHGWYFKLWVRIDGLDIDITENFLTYFGNMQHLLKGEVQ